MFAMHVHPSRFIRRTTTSLIDCFATLVLPLCLAAAPPLEFRTPPSFPVGDGPGHIVTADINGDGLADLATANFDDGTVSILFGLGAATFAPAIHISVGAFPDSLTVGDINADGWPDIVTANGNGWNQPGTLSVLLGSASGTFTLRTNLTVDRGPRGVVIADFNGDNHPDLATAISGGWFETNKVNVLYGNGDGTFAAPVHFTVGTAPSWIDQGDFNHDGRPDLVVVNAGPGPSGTTASVLLNTSEGPFALATTCNIGTYAGFVLVRDFNHDGHPDFATANRASGNLSVLLGRGDGTFNPAVHYAVPAGVAQLACGDYNGDGATDLAALGSSVSILLNNGEGVFGAPVEHSIGAALQAISCGNFNGDTQVDLVVAGGYDSSVLLMPGKGDGTFRSATDTYTVGGNIRDLATGDFNKDAQLDIVATSIESNSVSVLIQQTNGVFLPAVTYPAGTQPYGVKIGDFNNDGWQDLVVANFSGTLTMLRGRTTAPGVFTNQWGASFLGTVNLPGSHTDVAVGYFNSDNHLDIVTPNYYDATVTVALGDGTGQFHTPLPPAIPVNSGPSCVVVDDFNGDGKADVAVGYDGGTKISIAAGRGDGMFDAKVDINTWEIPWFIRSGDVNFDGKPDLVAAHGDWRNVSIMLNTSSNGVIQFAAPIVHDVANGPLSVGVCDFNGDNLPDIVSGNYACVSVLLGHGDGTFETATNYFMGGQYVIAGDFNNDEMPDLAIDLGGKLGLFWNDTLPRLQIKRVGGGVRVAWPAWKPYILETSTSLNTADWTPVTNAPFVYTNQYILTNAASGAHQLYRLKRPATF